MQPSPRDLLGANWKQAARKLTIDIHIPFTLEMPGGARYPFACLLPQFGAPRGMLLDVLYDKIAADAAVQVGFGFSIMDPDLHQPLDLSGYIDCLHDWGWVPTDQRPPLWYKYQDGDAG